MAGARARGPRSRRSLSAPSSVDEPVLGEREGVVVDDDAAGDGAAQDGPHPGEPAQPRLHRAPAAPQPGNGIPDPQAAASRVGYLVAHAEISSPGCCSRGRARARTRARDDQASGAARPSSNSRAAQTVSATGTRLPRPTASRVAARSRRSISPAAPATAVPRVSRASGAASDGSRRIDVGVEAGGVAHRLDDGVCRERRPVDRQEPSRAGRPGAALDSRQCSYAFCHAPAVRGPGKAHAKAARNIVNDADHLGPSRLTR